jgi:hypothetical protein
MTQSHVKPLPPDPEVLERIREMRADDVPEVAALHRADMGSSLWAQCGERFLREVYRGLLSAPDFRGFVYVEEGRVGGFIAGTTHGPRMFRKLYMRLAPRLALALLPVLPFRPQIAWYLLQSFFYAGRSRLSGLESTVAESLFCSFRPELRGKRISGLINKVLFDQLASEGHESVLITTDADNPLSARQLTSWGFERLGRFRFYGKEMIAWRLDLLACPRVEAVSWRNRT